MKYKESFNNKKDEYTISVTLSTHEIEQALKDEWGRLIHIAGHPVWFESVSAKLDLLHSIILYTEARHG